MEHCAAELPQRGQDFGKVVGVDYRFSGMGDVDYLRLKKLDDTIVFENDF